MYHSRSYFFRVIGILLRPVAQLCLKNSLRIQDIVELLKQQLVAVAVEELNKQGHKATTSRVSAMTGLHRRDVSRLQEPEKSPSNSSEPRDLVTKVLGLWQTHKEFLTKNAAPRVLSCGTEGASFNTLVAEVSSDLNPATVLFELQRVGAVQIQGNAVRLRKQSYTPTGDLNAGFNILAADMQDLAESVSHNLIDEPILPNLHARTLYDKIRADRLDDIKEWLLREGHSFHSKAREFLSQFDQDIAPDKSYNGPTAKVVVSGFSNTVKKDKQ